MSNPTSPTVLVDRQDWIECERERIEIPVPGADLFVGINVGTSAEMAALTELWVHKDMAWARVHHFAGSTELAARDLYSTGRLVDWAGDGLIETSPVPFQLLLRRLEKLLAMRPEARLCMNPWNRDNSPDSASDKGLDLLAEIVRDGVWMGPAIEQFRTRVASRRLAVEMSPVLRWQLVCTAVNDEQGTLEFAELWRGPMAKGSDAGIVSLVMTCGLAAFFADG